MIGVELIKSLNINDLDMIEVVIERADFKLKTINLR